jgi:hypothetical protein
LKDSAAALAMLIQKWAQARTTLTPSLRRFAVRPLKNGTLYLISLSEERRVYGRCSITKIKLN